MGRLHPIRDVGQTLTLGAPSADAYVESVALDGVPLTVGVARRAS